jgi:hypothetical protein
MNEKGLRRQLLHQRAQQPDTKQPLRSNRAQRDEMSAIGVASPRVRGMAKDRIPPIVLKNPTGGRLEWFAGGGWRES